MLLLLLSAACGSAYRTECVAIIRVATDAPPQQASAARYLRYVETREGLVGFRHRTRDDEYCARLRS
jgi:hypothetical protein